MFRRAREHARTVQNIELNLNVRRFQPSDTSRVHNLFVEESRCLIWPVFVQTLRNPSNLALQIFIFIGIVSLFPWACFCGAAFFGITCGASATFIYSYRWFIDHLHSSLHGDLANISEYYLSRAKSNFFVAEFDGSVIGFIAVDQKSETLAELKRISVDTCYARGRKKIADKLIEEALGFCKRCGYNEIVVGYGDALRTTYRSPRRISLNNGLLDRAKVPMS